MAIWYLNMLQENESGMKVFQYMNHQFWGDDNRLKADVGRTGDSWGVRFYKNNMWVKDEVYKNKSESYAEDAAENYVLGIKDVR
tara:strand:+ start:576 stop:827 length:252 start_codon:yes stop_codon:yes gene_type:complete